MPPPPVHWASARPAAAQPQRLPGLGKPTVPAASGEARGTLPVSARPQVEPPRLPSPAGAGVVQPGRSQAYKTRRSRHRVIRRHLERAESRTNASEISALVFHNGERVHSIPTIRKDDLLFASTPLVYARHPGVDNATTKSDDGEMHILDRLALFLPRYLARIPEGFYSTGEYHTYPPFDLSKRPPQTQHVIRIELIGPKGTCEDCQEALGRYLHKVSAEYPQTPLGVPIRFEINARWAISVQSMPTLHVDLKGRKTARMSEIYGSRHARKKVSLGGKKFGRGKGTVPEHWKLKVLASARQTVVPQSLFDKPSGKHLIFSDDDEEG